MLYEYYVMSEEYDELKWLLWVIGVFDGYKSDKGYVVCFILFCLEWYWRDYEREYGWVWELIYKMIGILVFFLEMGKIIFKGLDGYWGCLVWFYDIERWNFLGFLFSEGGLFFRLLKEFNSCF